MTFACCRASSDRPTGIYDSPKLEEYREHRAEGVVHAGDGQGFMSRQHSVGSTSSCGPGIQLAFTGPTGGVVKVRLASKPLCMRFAHSSPLMVTQVSEDLHELSAVKPGSILTHVNGVAVSEQWRQAAAQLREALRDLPDRGKGRVAQDVAQEALLPGGAEGLAQDGNVPADKPSKRAARQSLAKCIVSGLPKCAEFDAALTYYQAHLANAKLG